MHITRQATHKAKHTPKQARSACIAQSPAAPSTGYDALGNPALRLWLHPDVQTRLSVSDAGDAYEQEADRVTDELMRMPDPARSPGIDRAPIRPLLFQRRCTVTYSEVPLQARAK